LWKCRFEDLQEDDGQVVIEEYNAEKLAGHLSAAHNAGCGGPAVNDQPEHQLLAIQNRAAFAGGGRSS
jgi:hypothetical protein